MATQSSILACRIPRTKEPEGLQSMGLQRVRHDGVTHTTTAGKGKSFTTNSEFSPCPSNRGPQTLWHGISAMSR